jgi:hypothetical protein
VVDKTSEASRRDFLSWVTHGLGSAAVASLLLGDSVLHAAPTPQEAGDPRPHFPPRATRAIHICLCGAMSQVDSFDYKPELIKSHGKSLQSSEKPDVFFGQVGLLRKPDWAFKQRGNSGLWISELFPHLAQCADELTVINSMVSETSNHTPATFQENTGFRLNGFPTMGAWLSYGLGSESENLPAYVVIPDAREYPAGGAINWSNGFLPSRHQGVVIRARGNPIDDLFPAAPISSDADRAAFELVETMNRKHLEERGINDALSSRIRSYQLAAKLQLAVPEVTDLAGEPESVREMYGLNGANTQDFGRSCLLARRLVERGVRFVQLFSGGTFSSPRRNWDGHEDVMANHGQEALRIDQPVAALLKDLRRRGMLEDTLVLFTTEFGRTPFTQSAANQVGKGRDHNQYGFTIWAAGGGFKPGITYGATDDIGWKAAVNPTSWYDFHATVLNRLGINHERLTYYHNGIQRRLTNVHGQVIGDLIV